MAIKHTDIQAMRTRINTSLSGPKTSQKRKKELSIESRPSDEENQLTIFDFLEILTLTRETDLERQPGDSQEALPMSDFFLDLIQKETELL